MKARLNIKAALPAIEFCSAGTLNTSSGFGAAGSCRVDFGRIDIIADAMDHEHLMTQLRMNVNSLANQSQKHKR